MAVQREQFDELLGGREELPPTVSIIKFFNARSQEISALTEAIEEPQNTHLAFQRLPKHLRRRAMSHNVKRMPRRLRDTHVAQLEKSGLPVKGKRPSRKHRRRPSNLLQEYNRRQRKAMWLETHIWHAKRFHMVERWGYKLPLRPTDKSFRACYRATAKHCLIQDISYYNCVELVGPEVDILDPLSSITSSECGLTFRAKCTINGNREGTVTVFRRNSYPFNAIGSVSFMWQPECEGDRRRLWIWSHPAFYHELLKELIDLFELKLQENSEMQVDPGHDIPEVGTKLKSEKSSKKKEVEKVKLETRNIGKLPRYTNGKILMILLKDTLNRFRLTGPLAQVVLTEALKFVDIESVIKPQEASMEVDSDETHTHRSEWLVHFYEQAKLTSLKQQQEFWNDHLPNVACANELPPRMIVAATVMDPRLSMPSTRTKATISDARAVHPSLTEGLASHNPLWAEGVRDRVTHSKMAPAELNTLRSRALVPGQATPDWLGHTNVSHLPLLLIQRPGSSEHSGYGSGWDVVLPAGWAMPVWLGLVYRGARPGGLRETERLGLEGGTGPTLAPDSAAGQLMCEAQRKEATYRHFRLPPDKRPNYIKLGVVSPFLCVWSKLLQDWSPGEDNRPFYVIRNRAQLTYLKNKLNHNVNKFVDSCTFTERDTASGLVQVGVELSGRGTLCKCSMICCVMKKDLKLIKDKSGRGPVERLHEDMNEGQRKALRDAHISKLKRLRKKRVRSKRLMEDNDMSPVKSDKGDKKSPTEDLVRQQAEVMRELWLPSEVETVRRSSSHSVMGFVTCGDYSFTRSRTFGYGFVSLAALLSVLERNQTHFLVRNVTSLQYYFAKLKILDPV